VTERRALPEQGASIDDENQISGEDAVEAAAESSTKEDKMDRIISDLEDWSGFHREWAIIYFVMEGNGIPSSHLSRWLHRLLNKPALHVNQ
jgi:hypothetical protein